MFFRRPEICDGDLSQLPVEPVFEQQGTPSGMFGEGPEACVTASFTAWFVSLVSFSCKEGGIGYQVSGRLVFPALILSKTFKMILSDIRSNP